MLQDLHIADVLIENWLTEINVNFINSYARRDSPTYDPYKR